jgi:tetratricopeptide (TPR) repeat protein
MRFFVSAGLVYFLILSAFTAFAQENSGAWTELVKSAHYEVSSDSDDGEQLTRELEERFAVYNKLFRFDPELAGLPLRVRSIKNKADYDAYVTSRLGGVRSGAVYLHYNQAGRRELVVNRGGADEWLNLPYQAFIQYFRAFIPFPPSWMKEGFAIYFSTLRASETGNLTYEENLSWLETIKGLGDKAPPLETVLLADENEIPENFQCAAWALSSFLLSSGQEDYFRALTDCFMVLSGGKTAAENSRAVMRRFSLFINSDTFNKDYRNYIGSRRTFAELLDEGQKAYAARDTGQAEFFFLSAMSQKPGHFAPYYYLGLLSYEENNYAAAEQYYLSSIEYGADEAQVLYALGVNAASAGKSREAVSYLEQAARANPGRYAEKAESLISRLK